MERTTEMKKVFILTGASGNIGSNVCRILHNRGENIRTLVLPGDYAVADLPCGVEKIQGNLLDTRALEELFNLEANIKIFVIHMAAVVTTAPHFDPEIYDINVNGTKKLLNVCRKKNIEKFVYVSSTSAIPEQPKGTIQKEISFFSPENVLGFYAKTKAEATQAVLDAAEEGLNASVVFPTATCGPKDIKIGFLTQAMIDCANRKLAAGIVGSFDIVDVRDVANGIILCAEKGMAGESYILSGHLLDLRELFHQVHLHTGTKEIKIMLPFRFMKMLLPLFWIYYKLTKNKAVFTSDSLYNMIRNNEYSNEKAERELGYRTRPASETIKDTLIWLQEIGEI